MARFPDLIDKTLSVEGQALEEVFAKCGIKAPIDLELPLSPTNRPGPSEAPVPTNRLVYTRGAKPKLVIKGHWLDAETGTGDPVPRYCFSSPFLALDTQNQPAWRTLIHQVEGYRKATAPITEAAGYKVIFAAASGNDAPQLLSLKIAAYFGYRNQVEVMRVGGRPTKKDQEKVPGNIVEICFDPRPAARRQKVMKEHGLRRRTSEGLDD